VFDVVLSPELNKIVNEKSRELASVRLAAYAEIQAKAFWPLKGQEQQEQIAATAAISAERSEVRVSAGVAITVKRKDGSVLTVDYTPDGGSTQSIPAAFVDLEEFEDVARYPAAGGGMYFTLPRCELERFQTEFGKTLNADRPYDLLQDILIHKLGLEGGLPKDAVKTLLKKQEWCWAGGDDPERKDETKCLMYLYELQVDESRLTASAGALLKEVEGARYHWVQAGNHSRLPRTWLNGFVFDTKREGGMRHWNLLRRAFTVRKKLTNTLRKYMGDVLDVSPSVQGRKASQYQTFHYAHSYPTDQVLVVPIESRRWKNECPDYEPKFYTALTVRTNSRKLKAGGWADPEDIDESERSGALTVSARSRDVNTLNSPSVEGLNEAQNQIVGRLKRVPLLKQLDDSDLRLLANHFETQKFKQGRTVVRQDDVIGEESMLYFLDQGQVDVYVDGAKVVSQEQGSYFGETGLIEDTPRSASIIAATDLICLCLSRSDFRNLSENHENIRKVFAIRNDGVMFNGTVKDYESSDVSQKWQKWRLSWAMGKPVEIVMEKLKNENDGKNMLKMFPRNPAERTGIRGRGVLGKWGPNYVADPVITRDHPVVDGLFQVLVLCRNKPDVKKKEDGKDVEKTKDGKDEAAAETAASSSEESFWFSLPGGFTEKAEDAIPDSLARLMNHQMEFRMPSGRLASGSSTEYNKFNAPNKSVKTIDDVLRMMKESRKTDLKALASNEPTQRSFQKLLYQGYVTAPENTDNAWIQTHAQHFHLSKDIGVGVDIVKTVLDEQLQWMTIRNSKLKNKAESPLCSHHHELLVSAHEVLEEGYLVGLQKNKNTPSKMKRSKSLKKKLLGSKALPGSPKPVRALLIIDVQKDFFLDQGEGALGVPQGHTIVPVINYLRSKQFDHVFLCQDWHPTNHCSFCTNNPGKDPYSIINLPEVGPQQMWPDHCMQGSRGAEFHDQLITEPSDYLVRAGCNPLSDSYSAFNDNNKLDGSNLQQLLEMNGVNEIYCTGLATDYCVQYTVLVSRLQVQYLSQIHTFANLCLSLSTLGSHPPGRTESLSGRRGFLC
jgi:nicotinamidase/pyrazinamidase